MGNARVSVHWIGNDILASAEEYGVRIAEEEADSILMDLEEDLQDIMIQAGWDVINNHMWLLSLEKEKNIQ